MQGSRVADAGEKDGTSPSTAAMPTRRELMTFAGGLAAASALPFGRARAAETQPVSPVTVALSTYMSEARERALPPEVLERAKHHILDTIAAMVSGMSIRRSARLRAMTMISFG